MIITKSLITYSRFKKKLEWIDHGTYAENT